MIPSLTLHPPLSDEDLTALIVEALDAISEGEVGEPRWSIGSVDEAEWAARKLIEAQDVLREIHDNVARWEAEVSAYEIAESAAPTRTERFMLDALSRWALARRLETGQATHNLPSAVIRTQRREARPVVLDEPRFVAWALADPRRMAFLKIGVSKSEVHRHVALVERPAALQLTCGCVVAHDGDPVTGERGLAVVCGSCGADALVGDWLDVTLTPVDDTGVEVAGVEIEPAHLTASVKARS